MQFYQFNANWVEESEPPESTSLKHKLGANTPARALPGLAASTHACWLICSPIIRHSPWLLQCTDQLLPDQQLEDLRKRRGNRRGRKIFRRERNESELLQWEPNRLICGKLAFEVGQAACCQGTMKRFYYNIYIYTIYPVPRVYMVAILQKRAIKNNKLFSFRSIWRHKKYTSGKKKKKMALKYLINVYVTSTEFFCWSI